ncbi:WD-40 repeat-containing protein [Neolewinella xylanilytica]|uniref:WD-40 repeat-containing protein n=1 Tax=Neolewinella xylanilytica TaxID=1514080 RepID=A0A2S6I380_9BACT|nr:hypothetical protein [Neolewinella xylanilytica]PPK85627.1 WD-40 repeat-containing protein [Neolewinella xylanilytica]
MLNRQSTRSGHRAAIYDLHPAGEGFYTAAADGFLVHWHREDVDFGRVVANVEGGKFLCVTTIPDGLVAGALDGGVHWLYPDAPERNRHVAHHQHGVFSVVRVGADLYTVGGDGVLTVWSVPTARRKESVPLSRNSLRRIVYDPVYDRLAIGASDGKVYLLERSGLAPLASTAAHAPSVFALGFSPDGEYLFSGGRDAGLSRWSVLDGQLKREQTVVAHLMTVNALAVHPEGHYLATASRDKTVKLWRTSDLSLCKVIEVVRDKGHVNSVNTLTWLDGNTLLTAGDDRRVLEWGFRVAGSRG